MRRNCNLELRLLPPSSPTSSSSSSIRHDYCNKNNVLGTMNTPLPEQQQLTIFYDGKVVSCDVSELQARAIILLVSQEESKRAKSISEPSSPLIQSQLYSPNNNGLSMKRSLQRFLQKRKNRVQSQSPYHR